MKKVSSLSIVFPCLNDAGTIGSLVVLAEDVASRFTEDFEVIVVDDCSTDGSRELLDVLAKENKYLKVLKNEKNLGYGGAISKGLYTATKDYIFYTDGDAQYDVRELAVLLEAMTPETAVVNGYKITRSDPWYRVVLGKLYHIVAHLLFSLPVRDVDCDFRLFKKEVLHSFSLNCTGGVVCVELVKKVEFAGYDILQMPVHHHYRIHGKSQFFTLRRVSRVLWELLSLRWKFFREGKKKLR